MAITGCDTLPKLLKYAYEKYGDRKIAMREKDWGIWKRYTWKDYYERVKYFSLGLISLGLKPGDKVSILGENKPEWFWAELATQAARGAVIGIFSDCTPTEVKYYVEHSDSKFVVAHDQEQVDKVLEIKDELPLLKKVIYWDPKGLWSYDEPILVSFDEVVELGREYEKDHPGMFEENVKKGEGKDTAIYCYTSGTTGLPKGAVLSQQMVLSTAQSWYEIDRWRDDEQYVSFLPPAWVTEQGLGVAGGLLSGMVVNFPEEPETVQENIREVGGSILFFGPRLWENMIRMVQAKMVDTSALRRFLYNIFLPVGYKVADLRLAKEQPNWLWRLLYFVANLAVFRPLKDKLGLLGVRCSYCAGAAVSPDIFRYFQAIGVNIKQLYGSSEYGLITLHHDGEIKPETCGPSLPGMETRISEDGEIMLRTEACYSGYYKNPEATQERMSGDWFCSQDFGHIDEEGHLLVMDRMDDLKQLSSGRKFSPQYCEVRLRFSPYIKDALIIGSEDRDYVSSLINIDVDNVGRWAEARRIPYTTFTDLSQKPEVIQLVGSVIQEVNRNLPDWTRIRRFVSLHKEFDPDEAELTRTRKLRRDFIEDRYCYLVDALYSDKDELVVEAPITYRDGRRGVIKTSVKVNRLD